MNRRIVFISHIYPYGIGEKMFVCPELNILAQKYDIKLVSSGTENCSDNDLNFLSKNSIELKKYEGDVSINNILNKRALCVAKSEIFKKEFLDIIHERKQIFTRLKTSFKFVYDGFRFAEWLEANYEISDGDVFYSYWYYSRALGLAILKDRHPKIKIITRAHGYEVHEVEIEGKRECCKEYMDKRFDAISFVSKHLYDYYFSHNRIQPSEHHTIHHLGTPKAKTPVICDDNRGDRLVIVSCSRIDEFKWIDLIIEALSLINDYSVDWVHFGDGDLGEERRRYAERVLSGKANISYSFKGQVDREEIYSYYSLNEVNAYILLSYQEGLSVASMEALAHGLVIITNDSGGSPETIRGNGFLLPEFPKPSEVKMAIDSLRCMPRDKYVDMRNNSFKLWCDDFDVEKNIKEFEHYLKTV